MNFKIMKKLIYILFIAWICLPIQAQDMDDAQPQDASAKDKIKAARIGLITQRLNLTPEQAQKFWPLYNEFDQKRAEMRKPLREAQKNINPNNPDPKQQQALVELGLKIKQDELNLEKEYSNRMMGVITAQQMLNLRQAERDFRNIIINMLNNRRLQQQRKENFRDRNMRLRQKRN
jgi:Spy/CpxP family protein refolding chaperone